MDVRTRICNPLGKSRTVRARRGDTHHQIGVSDILMAAAGSTGGVTGKMNSPQSIAVACAAVGLVGRESELLRFTVTWSLLFLLVMCVVTYIQPYHLTGMIP